MDVRNGAKPSGNGSSTPVSESERLSQTLERIASALESLAQSNMVIASLMAQEADGDEEGPPVAYLDGNLAH